MVCVYRSMTSAISRPASSAGRWGHFPSHSKGLPRSTKASPFSAKAWATLVLIADLSPWGRKNVTPRWQVPSGMPTGAQGNPPALK